MVRRQLNILKTNSFFLFGPRGTGKSTLLKELFSDKMPLLVDLLLPSEYHRYDADPELLVRQTAQLTPGSWVILDEVQRIPKLLDVVHHLIEERKLNFALTGSSARRLKHGAANMLGGRAYTYHLHPLTHAELSSQFDLVRALSYGTLPRVWYSNSDLERALSLETYALTYLEEEIWKEHLVRELAPFRSFLKVAAQMNGEILNFSSIARDVNVDDKTVREYFSILEDTLVGFLLEAHDRSVRKRQTLSPKFYFFDPGVSRAIQGVVQNQVVESSNEYGKLFEQWLIWEIKRLNDYTRKKYELSYLRTKDNVEVDLILNAPGRGGVTLIEIKSTSRVGDADVKQLKALLPDFEKDTKAYCFSNDQKAQSFGAVQAVHWREGLKRLFG